MPDFTAAPPSAPLGVPEDLILITRQVACKILGCGMTFIDEITAAGALPVVRHSSRYTRIRLSDVRRFVESRAQVGQRNLQALHPTKN